MYSNNPIIASRRSLIDGLDAKRRFQERFAAAEYGRRRLPPTGPAITLGSQQDVVYYDALSFVNGYAATYFDEGFIAARFDERGVAVAHRVRVDDLTDRIESPIGAPLAYVRPVRSEPGVLVLNAEGSIAGSVLLRDGQTAEGRDADGQLVARGVFGPDRVVWMDPVGNVLAWAKSRLLTGAWLATEDAWHLFVTGWLRRSIV